MALDISSETEPWVMAWLKEVIAFTRYVRAVRVSSLLGGVVFARSCAASASIEWRRKSYCHH